MALYTEKAWADYELKADFETKHRAFVDFFIKDFEDVYNSKGPSDVVYGAGKSAVFGQMSDILMDNLLPLRYTDRYIPNPILTPPSTASEREHRYMARYRAIFDTGDPVPPPTGLWAACSKRLDNRTLIKRAPAFVYEKYKNKDPLGLYEIPLHFYVEVPVVQPQQTQPPVVVKMPNGSKDEGSKPAIPSRSVGLKKPITQKDGTSKPCSKPVVLSQSVGFNQFPSMESVREVKSEKDPSIVQKRLSLAANKLQYLAKRQEAGGDIWYLKQGKDVFIPEINFSKFWDEKKGVFVTLKKGKPAGDSFSRKKRPREEDECTSRKKQCTAVRDVNKLPFEAWLSTVRSYQKKRPREEEECASRKKQCVASYQSRPIATSAQVQRMPSLPGSVSWPVGNQRSRPQQAPLINPRPVLPVQSGFVTRMVPVATSGHPQYLPSRVQCVPAKQFIQTASSQQVSDLARFGLQYQLDIRPVD